MVKWECPQWSIHIIKGNWVYDIGYVIFFVFWPHPNLTKFQGAFQNTLNWISV